jgi:hypothetical protein
MILKTLSGCCSTLLMSVFPSVQLRNDKVRHWSPSSTPYPCWSFFDFEHQLLVSFAWLPFRTCMEDIFQHPTLVRNARFIEEEDFRYTHDVTVCKQLFVAVSTERHRRRVVIILVSSTLQTASWMRTTYWTTVMFSIRGRDHFLVGSISIRSWSIPQISGSSPRYFVTRIRAPKINTFSANSIFIDCLVDWWGFDTNGGRIRLSRIDLPLGDHFSENALFIRSGSTDEISRPEGPRFKLLDPDYCWRASVRNTFSPTDMIWSIRTDRSSAVTRASRQSLSLNCSPEKQNKRNDIRFYSKSESLRFPTFLLK